jgi:hypothetical protein
MKLNNNLFKKVEQLAEGVKKDFRTKGLAIPVKEIDGSVRFNDYTVIKNKQGLYSILNTFNDPIFDNINLAQTAIILANNLAIGKHSDDSVLFNDQQYGYNLFEEEQYKKIVQSSIKKKDWERVDTLIIKQNIAHIKAEVAKSSVLSSFQKFRRLR